METDEQLVSLCLAGNMDAHDLLYHRHYPALMRLAYGRLQHHEDAEEVVQDSFEYAFRTLSRYDSRLSALGTWLHTIAISRCHNKRRRKVMPLVCLDALENADEWLADDQQQPPDILIIQAASHRRTKRRVQAAIDLLSPVQNQAIRLRYYDGLTYPEMGDTLDIPAKTAASRVRLAHNALRQELTGWLQ